MTNWINVANARRSSHQRKLFHRRSKRRHFCLPDLLKDADVQLFEWILNATSTSKFDRHVAVVVRHACCSLVIVIWCANKYLNELSLLFFSSQMHTIIHHQSSLIHRQNMRRIFAIRLAVDVGHSNERDHRQTDIKHHRAIATCRASRLRVTYVRPFTARVCRRPQTVRCL